MIPILYDKNGTTKLGELHDILDGSYYVEEVSNGIFELTLDYPNGYPLADQLIEEKMIEVKPNDKQGLQKFRIYDTKKMMDNIIVVMARHESFDIANDHVENVDLKNASCEYALNTLFRNSHFSQDYRGYSDIINAQDYSIENTNILAAIAGKEGSIIDTYGNGAEILRDCKNIHVLNKRGHDNGVTIEYGKNLTGFELDVDLSSLETRCGGFAKYKVDGSDEEIIVKSDWIDSPFIENFAHPYINIDGRRDYSDKFKDGEIPTKEKLNKLCEDEFKINKRDIPSSNYKINFIPLSKCVGYENVEDEISLCDTVTIIDPRFNINTKAKVISYKYDFIKERYISMELGEPRTTLGDIIGNGSGESQVGPQGPPGPPGNIEDFPNTLPQIPVLTAKVYGFATIELSWTFEDKVYYTYELYASKTKDFTPNTFDLIHAGQSSSFLFQAKPNETWYFRVCAKNTHGERTEFSPQVIAITKKIDDLSNYVDNMAIGEALIGTLSLDRGWVGKLNANYLDVKGNFSVTNGNGKRTLDIDSFGDVHFMPRTFKVLIDGKGEDVVTQSRLVQTENKLQVKIEQTGNQNYVSNSDFSKGLAGWETYNSNYISSVAGGWNVPVGSGAYIVGQGDKAVYLKQTVKVPPKAEKYYASAYLNCTNFLNIGGRPQESLWHFYVVLRYTDGTGETKKVPCFDENHAQGSWQRKAIEFVREESKTVESIDVYLYVRYVEGNFYMSMVKVEIAQLGAWVKGINELNTEIVEVDDRGMWVRHEDGSAMNANSKSIDFTNENGRKKMAVKNGGLNYYNYQSGLFVGLDSSTQFSDQYSKFGMQKLASKHCSFYDILHSPTTENDDNLKLANSVFRICFENVEGPSDWRSVKGIHSFLLHRFHEGIDMIKKPIRSCGTIYMGTASTRNKVTFDDTYDEMQIGGGSGGVILGKTNQDGSVEHAIKIYENYYIDTTRDWNFQGHKIENANIITNFAPTPIFRSFAYLGNRPYTNLIDKVDIVNIKNDELALTKKEYDNESNQFNQTQLLYAAVEKIKELESTVDLLINKINQMKEGA